MGTATQYYVDSVGGNDGNAGTSFGAAWKTLKYAIETGITPDTTNGDTINMYAPVGTPDVYSSGDPAIALSSYATDALVSAPLTVRGVASDGSMPAIAYITCTGRYLVNDTTFDFSRWVNLSITGGSGTGLFQVDRGSSVLGCLLNNTGGGVACQIDMGGTQGVVAFSDLQGTNGAALSLLDCITSTGVGTIIGNYIHERTGACRGINGGFQIIGNVIHLNNSAANSNGISSGYAAASVVGNTILNDAASVANGIVLSGAGSSVFRNYIEGWSGAGGTAVTIGASNGLAAVNNRYFNCTNGFTLGDIDYATDNSILSASGVASRSGANYAPVGALRAIGLPLLMGSTSSFINVGAVQTNSGYSRGRVI